MPDNPFLRAVSPQEEPDETNPFAIKPKPLPETPEVDGPDFVQEIGETNVNARADEENTAPVPDADRMRAWAQTNTTFQDLPTPKTYTEAIGGAMKVHGDTFRPNPESSDDLLRLADKLAMAHLVQGDLWDENGRRAGVEEETVSRLRGAYLHNLTTLYSDMTPEELPRVNQRTIVRLGEMLKSNALSRLNETGTRESGEIIFDNRGTRLNPEIEARREAAEQDFAMAQELISRSEDPKVQSWFLGEAYRAADQLAMLAPEDSEEQDRQEIFLGILDAPFKQSLAAGWPGATRGNGPLAERYSGLLARNLKLVDQGSGKAKAFAVQRIIEGAFRGTLVEERMGRLGIESDSADVVTPINMLGATHPQLIQDLANVKAMDLGRIHAAADDSPGSLEAKIEEFKAQHGASIHDSMLEGGTNPLRQIQSELDTTVRTEAGDLLKDDIDKALEGLGAYAMTFSEFAGDKIGFAQKKYGELLGITEDEVRAGELMAGSTLTGIAGLQGEASRIMGEAIDEGEEDARLVNPEIDLLSNIGPEGDWMSDPNKLTRQVEEGTGLLGFLGMEKRMRLGLTKESMQRIFNPGHNTLRQIGMAISDEVAATKVEQMAPLGFLPSTIRAEFKKARSKDIGERLDQTLLRGITEEEFQSRVQHVAKVRRENGGGAIGFLKSAPETFNLAFDSVGRDVRGTMQFLLEEPDDLAVITGTGAGAGYIGNQVFKGVKNKVVRRVSRATTARRMNIALQRALRNSPDAVDQVRRQLNSLQKRTAKQIADGDTAVGLGQRHAALESATDALEYASDARKLTLEATPDLRNQKLIKWYDGQLKDSARKAAEITRHMDPRDMGELLDDTMLDGLTQNWIKNGGGFSTLREGAKLALGMDAGNKRLPFASGIGREIFDSIDADPTISMTDLPLSPEAVTSTNMRFLGQLFPGRRRQLAKAKYQQDALRWMAKYQKDTLARRGMGAEARSNLEEFTKFARVREANRLRRNSIMRTATNDPEELAVLQAEREASKGKALRLKALRQETLRSGRPLDKTRIRNAPVFDDYAPEELMYFLSARHSADKVYDSLRNQFESREAFDLRMMDMGRRFDIDSPSREAAASAVRKRIVAEFFEQPGLTDNIRIDLADGHVSPSKLRRNIRERQAIGDVVERSKGEGRQFMEDEFQDLRERLGPEGAPVLDDMLRAYDEEIDRMVRGEHSALLNGEFATRKNLKSEWAEVQARAGLERSNRFRVVEGVSGAAAWGVQAELAGRITDGRTRTAVADAKAFGQQQRLMVRAWTKKQSNLQRQMNKLTPDERALFNVAATIARDEGVVGPLKSLRKQKRFKEYFNEIAPETDDVAVQHLWDTSENFRKNLLKDMADVGLIDKEQFLKLIGPYAPRLFSSTMMPKLYGKGGIDLNLKDSGISGVSVGELMSQRHISQVKAQIYPKGGRPITQKFDTVQEAEDWIGHNHGFSDTAEFLEDGAGRTGATASGSKYAILEPLGKEAQELGADFIKPGEGMFIQVRNLIEDIAQIRYFNAFDRKGIAFTPEEFTTWARRNPNKAKWRYTQLPVSKRLGTLSGKHVHRSVLAQMDHYTDIRKTMKAVQDATEERAFVAAGTTNHLMDMAKGIHGKLVDTQKAMIAYNGIARNPATMIGNFLSDAFFFTRMAAGSEINMSLKGLRMIKESYGMIRDIRTGKRTLSEMPIEVQRGVELGVIDESIFEATGLETERRVLDIEAMYGTRKTPFDVFKAPFKDENVLKTAARQDEIETILARGDHSPAKEAQLTQELFTLDTITRKNYTTAAKAMAKASDVFGSLIGSNRGRTGDIESMSARFYGDLGNTNRMRAYLWLVREKGMTPEAAANRVNMFMQTYGKVGTNLVGNALQKLSKTGIGSPIVSYPFELARISLNVATKNPAALAAVGATSLARNMMAIGASGTDPQEALDMMYGDNPLGVLNLIGNQFIPLPNNESLIVGNPALNVYGQLANSYGVVNELASSWEDAGDDTPLAAFMNFTQKTAANVAFSNPTLNFGLGQMTKRNSLSGERERDGTQLFQDNLARYGSMLTPVFTPIVGSNSLKLKQNMAPFKHAYTGREHSMFNKVLEMSGFRIKGDASAFLDALPPSLGDPVKDMALTATKMAVLAELWEDVPERRVFGQSRGLGVDDYFGLVVAQSSYLDQQNGNDMDGANEVWQNHMRRGINLFQDGTPEEKEKGREMILEAEKNMIELRTTRQTVANLDFGRDERTVQREVRNLTTRLMNLGEGYEEALDSFSVPRRTFIVARMANTRGVPDKMMSNLFKQFLFTANSNNSSLRGPANVGEIESSRVFLEDFLVKNSDHLTENNARRLATMATTMKAWEVRAEARQIIEEATVEKYRDVRRLMDEVKEK